jgi:LPS export ABC transporter protein LptC
LPGFTVVLLAAVLVSCKNDLETIRSLDVVDTVPDMLARNVDMLYSERGFVQIRLESPLLVRKTIEQEPVMEFPEGFKVSFYDSNFHIKSTISGDYGISFEKSKLMQARHNVVVENMDSKERLNTEELFWDQNKETIYTDKFVRITRGDEVITADGLISDQKFESMEFKNPKGLIEVREEGPD